MIIQLLSFLLIGIFLFTSGLHFYWAAGGRWGAAQAAPMNEQGKPILNTGVFPSLVVGIGLLSFAVFYALPLLGIDLLPAFIGWIIPSIFMFRATGDFKYVGFFKKINDSVFAKADTKYFTPLCVLMAASGFGIKLLN
jgi:hypothetical protein